MATYNAAMNDSAPADGSVDGQSSQNESRGPCEVSPNPLINDLKKEHLRRGVLIPLKTTQEVRQDHTIVQAWITRAPTKLANDVITYVFHAST